MIRPFTCLCVLMAAGAGLYLYSVKHRTLMLDDQIAQVLQQADSARARSTVLRADYALLNQPDRLSGLAGRFLSLRPMAVTQYVQLAGLDRHLPPIQSFPREGAAAAPPPATAVTPDNSTDTDEADPTAPPATGQPMADAVPADAVPAEAPQVGLSPIAPRHLPASPPMALARRESAAQGDTLPRAFAANMPTPRTTDAARQTTRVFDAEHLAHEPRLPGTQYASGYHAEPMPMAAPRPVTSSVLATASLHPAGAPARPRITNAEAYVPAAYTPHSYARPTSPNYGAPRYAAPAVTDGSMLGSAGMSMAPPVPVAN